ADPEVRVDGDLKASIAQLTAAGEGFPKAELAAIDAAVKPHFARPPEARLAAQDVIEIAGELMSPGGVLFSETGIYITILEHMWKVDDPASYRGTSGGRTMGLTIPAILGAKLAAPETPMLGLGADGSLLMRLGELETLARAGVAAPLVILNDDALGTMRWRQKARGMPEYKLQLQRVDYAEVARCCGLAGATVDTPEAFREALKAAFAADVTTLIDCRLDAQAYQDSFGPTIGVLDP
ncbi:MAG: thiamine pyrophosphate-dependent enzyme, partial [Gemmatimonadetes bacterium]|nr:thiamine pyrophosphate-dependent enzyme [Gemmatimonadota bacterium]